MWELWDLSKVFVFFPSFPEFLLWPCFTKIAPSAYDSRLHTGLDQSYWSENSWESSEAVVFRRPRCVSCQPFCCAPLDWERPDTNLQRHTLVNCSGLGWSCYISSLCCIRKLCSSLWSEGTLVPGVMPLAFLHVHPPSVQLTSVRVCINQRSPVCKIWFWLSKRDSLTTWLDVDAGVLEIWRRRWGWQTSRLAVISL